MGLDRKKKLLARARKTIKYQNTNLASHEDMKIKDVLSLIKTGTFYFKIINNFRLS